MRVPSIILALVIVLGIAQHGRAEVLNPPATRNYTIKVAGSKFGIAELDTSEAIDESGIEITTVLYAGPLGERAVPFSATQGLLSFFVAVGMLMALLMLWVVRWQRRRAARS